MVALVCFIFYECLCVCLPKLVDLSGLNQISVFGITYSVLIVVMVLGEVLLYKLIVEPIKIQ